MEPKTGNKYFPFTIDSLGPKQNKEILQYFKGESTGFVRVGPKGYILPHKYKHEAGHIYNMPLRTKDVFVVSYPRSGTTLTQELVWMVGNDLDYSKSSIVHLNERFPFLELSVLFDPLVTQSLKEENSYNTHKMTLLDTLLEPGTEKLAQIDPPRYIKTHLPLSLLPPSTLDTAKVVYVARDPRDVAVSFFHLNKLFRILGFDGDFKTYWNFFSKSLAHWTPFFDHLKEAWDKRHHPNMLFLFYEELVKDLPGTVKNVAKFLNKDYTEKQVSELCEYLKFDNFKNNKSVNKNILTELNVIIPGEQSFIRKGKAGGWRDYFDEDMAREAEQWIQDNLRNTDLRLPSFSAANQVRNNTL